MEFCRKKNGVDKKLGELQWGKKADTIHHSAKSPLAKEKLK